MINSEAEYNQMLSDNNEYQYNNQMKQSSIDFLIDQLSPYICFPSGDYAGYNTQDIFDRAKEMHKDEIKEAWIEGGGYSHLSEENDRILAEEYYNDTFTK